MQPLLWLLSTKIRNSLGKIRTLGEESKLKVIFISLFILGYLLGGYLLMLEAFQFVLTFSMIGPVLVDRIFYIFFFLLLGMLILSACILTWSTLFGSMETEHLLLYPLPVPVIFGVKFLEVSYLSSWAFGFLSLPIMLAYGSTKGYPLIFYLLKTFCLISPFIVFCAALGFSLGLILVRFFFNRFGKVLLIVGGVGVIFYVHQTWQTRNTYDYDNMTLALNQMLHHTRLAVHPQLPSHWFASFFLKLGQEGWIRDGVLLQLLVSSVILVLCLSAMLIQTLGYTAWSNYRSLGTPGAKYSIMTLFHFFIHKVKHLPSARACLILKDMQIFLRDPTQSLQFIIFFALLGFYILNLKNMRYDISQPFWQNLIAYLNLGSVCLILATLSTRFIFPQISLEGKAIWILKFSTISMRQLVKTKFWSACFLTVGITVPLCTLSNTMLAIHGIQAFTSLGVAVVTGVTLASLAVGLGALFPNLQGTHTQAIVSRFGGT